MKKILFVVASSIALSGCMTPIGKEEFACPNAKRGGVCAGPRDIYNLTNDRENLNNLAQEASGESAEEPAQKPATNEQFAVQENGVVVYKPREHTQHTEDNYQAAEVVKTVEPQAPARDGFEAYPGNGEPIAPEPLAVLNPAKVMRVLVASYKDKNGNLNMPGYVYVQVEPEKWSFGEAANMRPSRVVPLEIRKKTQEEERNQQERAKGVSPLEYVTGGSK